MDHPDYFFLGKMVKTTGLKGVLSLRIEADDPFRYQKLESVYVDDHGTLVPFFLESIQIAGNGFARIKIKGIDRIEEAEPLVKKEVFLPLSALPELDEHHYYYHELPGCELCHEDGTSFGKIHEIVDAQSQYLAVLKFGEKEALFPLHPDLFVRMDRKAGKAIFKVPEGLFDVYTQKGIQSDDEN